MRSNYLATQGLQNTMIVVTRWYGGIHLGSDRFKDITAACPASLYPFVTAQLTRCAQQVAREALEQGGFLDEPDDAKKGGGKGGKPGNANKPKRR